MAAVTSSPPRATAAVATGGTAASVLSEAYAGLENQGLGLAEAAGWSPRTCRIAPRRPWDRLPARFWPRPLAAVSGLDVRPGEIVVSVGGTAAAVAASLRRRDHVAVVQVQNPRMPVDRFDVVVANRHDRLAGRNVVVTRTALHRVTPAKLDAARAVWAPRLRHGARPLVAVLVGGANGRFRFGPQEASSLGRDLAAMCRRDGVALALTPSRRTAPASLAALRASLRAVDAYIWSGEGENPYLGLLAASDAIVVTCDSISMVSEAVATHAAVHVVSLPGRSRRIGRFLAALENEGRVRRFAGRFDPFDTVPIDDTAEAAANTRRLLGC